MNKYGMPRVLILLPLLLGFAAAPASALQLVTEEYPPFNYTENGKLVGLSSDVVERRILLGHQLQSRCRGRRHTTKRK